MPRWPAPSPTTAASAKHTHYIRLERKLTENVYGGRNEIHKRIALDGPTVIDYILA